MKAQDVQIGDEVANAHGTWNLVSHRTVARNGGIRLKFRNAANEDTFHPTEDLTVKRDSAVDGPFTGLMLAAHHNGPTNDFTETIAAYTDEQGRLCTIDHLGICFPSQAGTYVVYRDGEQTAEFVPSLTETVLPEHMAPGELVQLAKAAVAERDEEE